MSELIAHHAPMSAALRPLGFEPREFQNKVFWYREQGGWWFTYTGTGEWTLSSDGSEIKHVFGTRKRRLDREQGAIIGKLTAKLITLGVIVDPTPPAGGDKLAEEVAGKADPRSVIDMAEDALNCLPGVYQSVGSCALAASRIGRRGGAAKDEWDERHEKLSAKGAELCHHIRLALSILRKVSAGERLGRPLNRKGREQVAEGLLLLHSDRSDRWIAEDSGVTHDTVRVIRLRMEADGEIVHHDRFIGKDGREQPRSK